MALLEHGATHSAPHTQASAAFDTSARVSLHLTAILGAVVAWAAVVPEKIRFILLFAAFGFWVSCILYSAFCGLLALRNPARSRTLQIWTVLGAIGIGMALLCAAQLEIIRVAYARPDLTWNVDWRYSMSHAQGIAKFGSLDHSLDYAGSDVEYHVGPAWLASAVHRTLGFGADAALYGLVPTLSTMTTIIAAIHLISLYGVSRRIAAAAVGTAACVPLGANWSILSQIKSGPLHILTNADSWTFAPALMLNSHLGLALGMSCLALLLDRRERAISLIVAGIGLASLAQIKPQYLIGIGCVAGFIALGRMVAWRIFAPRSAGALVACAISLAVVVLSIEILPRFPPIFDIPYLGFAQLYSMRLAGIELIVVPLSLALFALIAWHAGSVGFAGASLGRLVEPIIATILSVIVLAIVLAALDLPLRQEVIKGTEAAGVPWLTLLLAQNVLQLFTPLRFLMMSLIAAALFTFTATFSGRGQHLMFVTPILASLLVVSPAPYIAQNFMHPSRGYEAAEDTELHEVLRAVKSDGSLLISSDLADPAEDTSRNLRGILLSAYEGHEFYVSNVVYLNYLAKDVSERLANVRAFFGSPWTPWHARWLAEAGISHVLIHHTRCLPAWWAQRVRGLTLVKENSSWSVFAGGKQKEAWGQDSISRPTDSPIEARFGRAACLQ